MKNKLQKIKNEYNQVLKDLSDPSFQADRGKMAKLSKKESELKKTVAKIDKFESLNREITDTKEMMEAETEEEMKEIAGDELRKLEEERHDLEDEIEALLSPKNLSDEKNAILEIRAGTGGDEAELFAADLFRMYKRFSEKKSFKVSIMNSNRTGIGGIKEIILEIKGKNAYGKLKYEAGVHRVQRIPSTEKSGRIHTSAATVAVLPEAEETQIDIKGEDIKVDTFRSSGPGGQSVNTTNSAVRITHKPTGAIVSCQDEKSQLKNRQKAMKILRSRLLQAKTEAEAKKRGEKRKIMVGTGDRSEKIRTYNFPQDRITDHRIKLTKHGIQDVLEGNLNPIIEKLLKEEQKIKLNN